MVTIDLVPKIVSSLKILSCRVAVGELASTSQLPSPHGGPGSSQLTTSTPPPAFTGSYIYFLNHHGNGTVGS